MSERGKHAAESRRSPLGAVGRGVGMVAAGAVLFAGAGLAFRLASSPDDRRYAAGALHHATGATPQEQRIGNAIEQTFGEKTMVRCAPMPDYVAELSGQPADDIAANTVSNSLWGAELHPAVRITPEVCDAMMQVADRKEPFTQGSRLLLRVSMALGVESHEGGHGHVQEPTAQSESQANCYSVQLLETTALAMGASQVVADQLSDTYAANINKVYAASGYDTNPATCRPGGADDLFPGIDVALNPGTFPPDRN